MGVIKEKTLEINERCEKLLSKAIGTAGTGAFASVGDDEAIMIKDAFKLIQDCYELMTMTAEALDKIEKIERSNQRIIDMIEDLQKEKSKKDTK